MLVDLFKQLPWQFKIAWVVGGILQLTIVLVLIWAVVRLVLSYT